MCDASTLMKLMKYKQPISSQNFAILFRQLVNAIKYLHTVKTIVHGCIDIFSVLINADLSLLQLTDFRNARKVNLLDPRHMLLHDQPGDPMFKSFEVILKKFAPIPASDINSCCMVVRTLASNKFPFQVQSLLMARKDVSNYYKFKCNPV